jgi:tetratricopeptide (TPR) repeat protein
LAGHPAGAAAEAALVSATRFTRGDWGAAGLVFAVTLAGYIYTLAPTVTLEDSGEFITGAVHLGVPHPPGYPFWTLCGFLISHLCPVGNVAWRINLLSALFAAVANGALALLVAHSGRWFIRKISVESGRFLEAPPFFAAVGAGLALGFSDAMWSQAVITEVYTLNAMFLVLILLFFYRWVIEPEKTGWLVASSFFFCLGLTNHHTLLFLLPAFFLAVFLGHRGVFWSFLIGIGSVSLSALACLAWYSSDGTLQEITMRMGLALGVFFCVFLFFFVPRFDLRRFLAAALLGAVALLLTSESWGDWFEIRSWRGAGVVLLWGTACGLLALSILRKQFILLMFATGWIGLGVYGYMPLASSTNPPMNWGYAREKGGFYHAVNRGQYDNPLSSMIKPFLGAFTGVRAEQEQEKSFYDKVDYAFKVAGSVKFYFRSLENNFSLPLALLSLLILLYWRRLDVAPRTWLWFLFVAFFFLAFLLQILSPPPGFDRQSLWQTRPFHLQSHCIFALLLGYGFLGGILYIRERFPAWPGYMYAACLGPALIPFFLNYADCSLRGHWFGWQYGVDMLRPLEKGAVVFGGTDPGRFIPTYAIFCESTQPARWKRDPGFDRSDLYIITQNALADRFYLKYIRDHYDGQYRPRDYSWLEKQLGRDRQYPEKPLKLPSDREFNETFRRLAETMRKRKEQDSQYAMNTLEGVFTINGLLSQMIFEKNKRDHAFYIEESLPMPWVYPYSTPAGLLLKIHPDPVSVIPPEIVRQDREFWNAYAARLLADKNYLSDPPARKAFSKLRLSIGNLYAFRAMLPEAEYAYQQALVLDPGNMEAVHQLAGLLRQLQRYDEAEKVLGEALQADPLNGNFEKMQVNIRQMRRLKRENEELSRRIGQDPRDLEALHQLIQNRVQLQDWAEAEKFMIQAAGFSDLEKQKVVEYVSALLELGRIEGARKFLERRIETDPKSPELYYNLAALHLGAGRKADALEMLQRTIEIGGEPLRQAVVADERWRPLINEKQFRKMIAAPAGAAINPPTTRTPKR